MTFHVPDKFRVTSGALASTSANGNNGAFVIPSRPGQPPLFVIATDSGGWEHVSVSRHDRVPTWGEMSAMKDMFWDAADCVMQLHPPQSDWVNNHSRCLHLWRPVGVDIPRPPAWMVGVKSMGTLV